MRDQYTEAENAHIKEGVAAGLSYSDIATMLPGRTIKSVSMQVRRMGLKANYKERPLTKNERDYLRRLERAGAEETLTSNEAQDAAFQRALKKAIDNGLELVTEGVCTDPCTENPVVLRPAMPVFMRSSALMCVEHGDARSRGAFV